MRPLVLALVLQLVPRMALACPVCARQGGGPALVWLLFGMIVLPFGVAAVVLRFIRRSERLRLLEEAAEGNG